MSYYAALFFVVSTVAVIIGFTGIAAGAAEMANILFLVFPVISVFALVMTVRKRP